jgi:hypothetical protein
VVDKVQKRGQTAGKEARMRLRAMTPTQMAQVSDDIAKLDEAFDSERILEEVVYLDRSAFVSDNVIEQQVPPALDVH